MRILLFRCCGMGAGYRDASMDKEFNDIDRYRELLLNKKITGLHFAPDADEGLVVTCDDGATLYFGFSGCEGTIIVGSK